MENLPTEIFDIIKGYDDNPYFEIVKGWLGIQHKEINVVDINAYALRNNYSHLLKGYDYTDVAINELNKDTPSEELLNKIRSLDIRALCCATNEYNTKYILRFFNMKYDLGLISQYITNWDSPFSVKALKHLWNLKIPCDRKFYDRPDAYEFINDRYESIGLYNWDRNLKKKIERIKSTLTFAIAI